MVSLDQDRLIQSGREALGFGRILPAEHVGAILLSDLIDPQTLPFRLRNGFADRPWPTHRLFDRIVSPCFIPDIPYAPLPEGVQPWTVEIVDDTAIRVEGSERPVTGHCLELLNISLLTLDWRLRFDDYVALGFADYVRDKYKKSVLITQARIRLNEKVAPHTMFETSGSPRNGIYWLSRAARVNDLRVPIGATK